MMSLCCFQEMEQKLEMRLDKDCSHCGELNGVISDNLGLEVICGNCGKSLYDEAVNQPFITPRFESAGRNSDKPG